MLLSSSVSALVLAAVSLAQGDKPFPVTGVPVNPQGPVPLRQNINELQNAGGAQWDLYIQALAAMQDVASEDPLGYFQIAGIHGAPYIEWDNTGGKEGNGWLGYCPHGENIFLTWHRPYVLLHEQILVSTAMKIAATYPQRYRYQYQQAAENLRQPYWDWAAQTYVPQATVPKTLRINVPDGQALREVDFDNPLQTYIFPPEALNGTYGAFNPDNRTRTVRCPPPQSYPDSANEILQGRPYKEWVYDVLTRSADFDDFASTSGPSINLEQIHNAIHWDAACGNQFLSPPFAGFDPLFMLHHSNVDRLWAYWQAIKPEEAIFTNRYKGQSRFSTPPGTVITPQSPLEPFSQADGQFHTTESIKSIQGMGYSYQGLEYWQKSPAQMKSDATKLVNRLYGPGDAVAKRSSSYLSSYFSFMRRREESTTQTQKQTRYFVRISVDVAEVERPCEINVFVGGQRAGSFIVMMLPAEGVVYGGFTVDKAVQKMNAQGQTAKSAMDAFQSNLEVEITKRDGSTIPVSSVPSLDIQLEMIDMTPASNDDEFPEYGTSLRHVAFAAQRSKTVSS